MTHIKDKEAARDLSDNSLYRCMAGNCPNCAIVVHAVLNDRARKKMPQGIGQWVNANPGAANKKEGQYVNAKPKVRSSHDLGFLIRDKSGELTQIAVKDVDSAMPHDMLDRADEIVISRVDVK